MDPIQGVKAVNDLATQGWDFLARAALIVLFGALLFVLWRGMGILQSFLIALAGDPTKPNDDGGMKGVLVAHKDASIQNTKVLERVEARMGVVEQKVDAHKDSDRIEHADLGLKLDRLGK